jgi:hypothetical protein
MIKMYSMCIYTIDRFCRRTCVSIIVLKKKKGVEMGCFFFPKSNKKKAQSVCWEQAGVSEKELKKLNFPNFEYYDLIF